MKWLSPRKHKMPIDGTFIIVFIQKEEPYITVGSSHRNHFKDFIEYFILFDSYYKFDICRADDEQYRKYSRKDIKAWMPLPQPPLPKFGRTKKIG